MPRAARGHAGRRRAGWGGLGQGCSGSAASWRTSWWSGTAWAGAGRLGWLRCGHARKVFDMGLTGRAPAITGRGGGPGAMGWLGVVQGDAGKVQDMVVQWIAAGWEQVGMGVACPWHGMLRLGFRAWGVWGMSSGCRGYRVSAGQEGTSFWQTWWWHLKIGYGVPLALFVTSCILNAKIKREV